MSSKESRSQITIWFDAMCRLIMWKVMSRFMPIYLVAEYPKSGGSWFGQMIADYLEIPFPRQERPKLRSCVLHGHYLYDPNLENTICVVRDGRDVMVSAYFHYLFHNDRNKPRKVNRVRDQVSFNDYNNVRKNIGEFIHYMFELEAERPFHFSWDDFIRSCYDEDVPIIKYEDLLDDASVQLKSAIEKITNETPSIERLRQIEKKYSFENISGRSSGEEDRSSFARKGIAGDWKNKFSEEACRIFNRYAGEELILMGYEEDYTWVEDPPLNYTK